MPEFNKGNGENGEGAGKKVSWSGARSAPCSTYYPRTINLRGIKMQIIHRISFNTLSSTALLNSIIELGIQI